MNTQLNPPTNQTEEVLHELITNTTINRRQMFISTGILNLTARIADLRNKFYIPIKCTEIEVTNKFGRKVKYGEWSLEDKERAILIYHKLQQQK